MYPFRLGTTSYILQSDMLSNVRYLVGKAQDVELILFEVAEGTGNLPSPAEVAELAALAEKHGLTFTVHLPLDLRLGAGGDENHVSLVKARKVIECTRDLKPWAYVLHLDGREVVTSPPAPLSPRGEGEPPAASPTLGHGTAAVGAARDRGIEKRERRLEIRDWQNQAVRALEIAAEWAGGPDKLAVENLEHYPLDFLFPVVDRIPVTRCVDVGHLWLDGHDPLPYLLEALPRLRVVHLHGVAERDHQSLSHVPPDKLKRVMDFLLAERYNGVLTLEVFGEEDFRSSIEALRSALGVGVSSVEVSGAA